MDVTKNVHQMIRGGIEHRASKVSLVTGLSTIMSVAFQLVAVPVCLKYWGQETYGGWLALFSAFMLLRSLDAGYVAYVGNKLNQLYHQNTQALHTHLSSAVAGISVIGLLQLALAIAALVWVPLATLLGMPSGASSGLTDKLGLLVLVVSWVFTGSYIGIVHRLQIPAGLMYQAAWWSMVFQVSQFAAIMVAALLQLGLLQTSLLFALSQSVIYVASAVYVRQKLPTYYPWWAGAKVSTGLKDLGHSMMLTGSNLIQQGATNGLVLMVSALAGPAAVPVFTTLRTLVNLWTAVTNVMSTPLLPDVVRFHVGDEGEKLLAVNQAYWVLVGAVVNCGVLLSYPLLGPLFVAWTRDLLELDKVLLCFMLSSVVVSSAGGLMTMYLNGINSLRIVLAMSIIRGVVALGGGAMLYRYFGLAAFGFSILVGEIIVLTVSTRFFYQSTIFENVKNKSIQAIFPALLGAVSVCLFLIVDGLELVSSVVLWPCAVSLTICSSIWGWVIMDSDIKNRIHAVNPFRKSL